MVNTAKYMNDKLLLTYEIITEDFYFTVSPTMHVPRGALLKLICFMAVLHHVINVNNVMKAFDVVT